MKSIPLVVLFATVSLITNYIPSEPQTNSVSIPVEHELPSKDKIRSKSPIPYPIPIIEVPGPNQPINIGEPKKVSSAEMPQIPLKKKISASSFEELEGLLTFPVLKPAMLPGTYGSPILEVTETSVNMNFTNAENAKLSIVQMLPPKQDMNMEKMPTAVDESNHGVIDGKQGKMHWDKISNRYTIVWQSEGVHYNISCPSLQECIEVAEALVPLTPNPLVPAATD